MLLRYKTYKYRVPPKTGVPPETRDIIQFDEDDERRKVIVSLGIDPTLSDEELKEYKTGFAADFSMILDKDFEGEEYTVDEYVDIEVKAKKAEIDKMNEVFTTDFKDSFNRWELGGEAHSTIELPLDDEDAEKLIAKVEESEVFIEWVDQYEIEEATIDPQTAADYELIAFKIDDKYVMIPDEVMKKKELIYLAKENGWEAEEVDCNDVPLDAVVLSIYQFYQYVDSKKSNSKMTLVDMMIDQEQTELENIDLVDVKNPLLPEAKTLHTMKQISEDDIFGKLLDI